MPKVKRDTLKTLVDQLQLLELEHAGLCVSLEDDEVCDRLGGFLEVRYKAKRVRRAILTIKDKIAAARAERASND